MSGDGVARALEQKRSLVSKIAGTFVRRTGWIEYEDAVQIVNIEAWQVLQDGVPPGMNVDGMITRRGFRRLVDELRSGRVTGVTRSGLARGERQAESLNAPPVWRRNWTPGGGEGLRLVDLISDDRDVYAERDAAHDVGAAIATLPDREQLVVQLHYYEGLTRREVAELIEVSESRVGQLLERAHRRMRPLLAAA